MFRAKQIYVFLFVLIFKLGSAQTYYLKIVQEPPEKVKFTYSKEFQNRRDIQIQLDEIISKHIKAGYLVAGFDSIITDSLLVKAYFRPGNVLKWGKLGYNLNSDTLLIDSRIRINKYFGTYVLPSEFNAFNENIIEHYENNGYPFVRTGLKNVLLKNDSIYADIHIDRGKMIKIDSILVKGDLKISKSYFNKYVGISNGSFYDESKIRTVDKKLGDISFAKIIKPTEVSFKKDKATVTLFLKNKKSNQFNGILGIIPNDKTSGRVLLTGNLNLRLLNSFKVADIIVFNWEKLESSSQNLDMLFSIPYIYKQVGYNGSMELYKKDSSYVSVGFNNGITFSFNGSNNIRVFYKNKSSSIISGTGMELLTVLPEYADFSTNLYGLGMTYERLDYRFNPRKGYALYFDLASGTKNIKKNPKIDDQLYEDIDLETNQFEGMFRANIFIPVLSKLIIKIENNSGYIFGSTLFENELYRIGGLNVLRGFDEKSIYASTFFVNTLEPRFVFEQNSSLYAFCDIGFFEIDAQEYVRDNPIGIGVGLDFETNAGIFTINYAVGKQFSNPFELRSAKIHFGYLNRF